MLEQQSDVVFVFWADIFCLESYELGMEPLPINLFEAAVEACTMSNSGAPALKRQNYSLSPKYNDTSSLI
jgi:pantothenate kinase-related protein Tda10